MILTNSSMVRFDVLQRGKHSWLPIVVSSSTTAFRKSGVPSAMPHAAVR